ncbi:MAG: class I SAM-dependent methyltransferase [Elusimicrobiota bacterium]
MPKPLPSPLDEHGSWDAVYRNTKPEDLPWNAGGPDPELAHIVESGKIAPCRALDLGAGPGHDAIFLAKKGFKVLAVDISPAALELAKANAARAGIGAALDYRVENVLRLSLPPQTAGFINDRGCFHTLAPADRAIYIEKASGILALGGRLFLRVFSDKEPPGPGPYRFSRRDLEDLFSPKFAFLEFGEGIFEGPRKPKAYLCLLEKKPEPPR